MLAIKRVLPQSEAEVLAAIEQARRADWGMHSVIAVRQAGNCSCRAAALALGQGQQRTGHSLLTLPPTDQAFPLPHWPALVCPTLPAVAAAAGRQQQLGGLRQLCSGE